MAFQAPGHSRTLGVSRLLTFVSKRPPSPVPCGGWIWSGGSWRCSCCSGGGELWRPELGSVSSPGGRVELIIIVFSDWWNIWDDRGGRSIKENSQVWWYQELRQDTGGRAALGRKVCSIFSWVWGTSGHIQVDIYPVGSWMWVWSSGKRLELHIWWLSAWQDCGIQVQNGRDT